MSRHNVFFFVVAKVIEKNSNAQKYNPDIHKLRRIGFEKSNRCVQSAGEVNPVEGLGLGYFEELLDALVKDRIPFPLFLETSEVVLLFPMCANE